MSPALPDHEKELLQNAEENVCQFNESLSHTHTVLDENQLIWANRGTLKGIIFKGKIKFEQVPTRGVKKNENIDLTTEINRNESYFNL